MNPTIDQVTFDLFAEDRNCQAAFDAAAAKVKSLVEIVDDYYPAPAGTKRGQRYGRDYKIVYRNRISPDTVLDPDYANTTHLWPEHPNWRRACAANRARSERQENMLSWHA